MIQKNITSNYKKKIVKKSFFYSNYIWRKKKTWWETFTSYQKKI